jgi:hypothetical protein
MKQPQLAHSGIAEQSFPERCAHIHWIFRTALHPTGLTDVTLVAYCISLSFGPRFNIGINTKVFFDAGIYADLVVKSRMIGERDSCSFEKDGLICRRIQINEDAGLSNTAGIYIVY